MLAKPHEHLRRDPRAGRADPHPRGRALLRRSRRRHAPAEVLRRLPAGAREGDGATDRVRDRRDPARRLREDPGHAPAGAVRRGRALRPRGRGAPELGGRSSASSGARRRGHSGGARASSRRSGTRSARRSCRRRPAHRGARARGLCDALGADAYWRQRTWKKVAVIFAGPATNLVFAIVLLAVVYAHRRPGRASRRSTRCVPDSPAAADRAPGGRRDRRHRTACRSSRSEIRRDDPRERGRGHRS